MSYLVDTNAILRFFDLTDSRNVEVVGALDVITEETEEVYVCAQVIIEYWAVATRPREANGMGLSIAEATEKLDKIGKLFPCLPEPPDVVRIWREVVGKHSVCGKQAHDARLMSLMLAHGVTRLLTLNPGDFARYQEITVVTPQQILQTGAGS